MSAGEAVGDEATGEAVKPDPEHMENEAVRVSGRDARSVLQLAYSG